MLPAKFLHVGRYALFFFIFFLSINFNTTAKAQTVNCTGSNTATADTFVFFDNSAGTCTISNINPGLGVDIGDILAIYEPQVFDGFNTISTFVGNADSNLDGTTSPFFSGPSDVEACTAGDEGNLTSGFCHDNTGIASGSYVNSIKGKVNADDSAVMTLNITVVAGVSVTINSAKVVIGNPSSGGSSSSSSGPSSSSTSTAPEATPAPPPTPPVLQATVSRSQSKVVSTNIGTRLSSIGSSPVGVGRSNTGAGRTTPAGGGGAIGGGSGTTTDGVIPTPENSTNFAAGFDASSVTGEQSYQYQTHGKLPWRQLATLASFDTSNMVLNNTPEIEGLKAPEQRTTFGAGSPLTAWGHASYTDVENSRNDAVEDSRFNGDVWGYNLGVDYQFRDNFYAGISFGISQTDLTTLYNSGEYDEDSWTITPYAVYQVTDALKLSTMFGYGYGDIDQSRNNKTVTSTTESDTWFAAVNASYTIKPAEDIPLELKSSLGILVTDKKVAGYTESDGTVVSSDTSNTFQIRPEIEAAYSINVDADTVLQPFVKVDFVHDRKDPINGDKSAFDLGGGLRIGSTTGFNGSIEGSTQVGRDNYEEYTLNGLIAYSFALNEEETKEAAFLEPYLESNFTQDGQVYGTGLNLRSHGNALTSKLSLSQTRPHRQNAEPVEKVNLSLALRF